MTGHKSSEDDKVTEIRATVAGSAPSRVVFTPTKTAYSLNSVLDAPGKKLTGEQRTAVRNAALAARPGESDPLISYGKGAANDPMGMAVFGLVT